MVVLKIFPTHQRAMDALVASNSERVNVASMRAENGDTITYYRCAGDKEKLRGFRADKIEYVRH